VDDVEFSACWEVQSRALDALGEIGDTCATEPIVEILEDDQYEDLQESGFRVLARLNNDRANSFLVKQLRTGGRLARRRAAQALAASPEADGAAAVLSPQLEQVLGEALRDDEPSVRIYAARALARSPSPRVVGPLTQLLLIRTGRSDAKPPLC